MYTSAKPYFYGTGRRKKSVARVRIVPGTGAITINGRDVDDYFGLETLKLIVNQPFGVTGTTGKFDIITNVQGGGISLNKEKVADPMRAVTEEDLIAGKYLLVQKGKKNYYLITVE